jgi:hypothetical protein
MQNMMKIYAAPVYWPLVAGASAAATDRATAMDNHWRNRSARSKVKMWAHERNKYSILKYY